jgi:hypothetical protein
MFGATNITYYTGKRLQFFQYAESFIGPYFVFYWFPVLQLWRGGNNNQPHASWVMDDYGVLVHVEAMQALAFSDMGDIIGLLDVTQDTLH